MAAVEASIQAALFARATSLVLSPAHPVAWPNVNFTPPANRRNLRFTHMPNTTERTYIGSREPHLHQGILQIMVVAPLNSGEAGPRAIAAAVADHFPTDLRLTSGGVTVRITKRPDIAAALATDTELQIPVSIRYEAYA